MAPIDQMHVRYATRLADAIGARVVMPDYPLAPEHTWSDSHAPWVDLTTSTPETREVDAIDPWLFLGKLQAYALWRAGSPDDLGRPEVSPALADLAGLPRAIMLYGTRDLLHPGCRLLVRRAAEAGWDLTAIEEPDLIHVYGLLPLAPEARRAFGQVVEFLR